jgi:hypothetical protein
MRKSVSEEVKTKEEEKNVLNLVLDDGWRAADSPSVDARTVRPLKMAIARGGDHLEDR